ncbi:hypothetical protein [Microbacterium binotii]|uniref:hypothetical protein n=1 Tax=Microbacterium binotii TaxID=462710 RepID=UPI001F3B1E56|nr:hypothetical protein [Microbacterium binotii]UIN31182.1 hypothetical protein LXM64_02940 [Microbacterium binotii]
MNTMSDAELLTVLRAADPASAITLSTAEASESLRRSRAARKPRRRLLIATSLAAVLVVGVPAGALASGLVARTGWFGSPNPGDDRGSCTSTEYDCNSEWIDLSAPDLDEVVESVYPEWMPLAPGVTREDLTGRVVVIMTADNALAPERLLRRTFESESYKDWLGAWIAAHDRGDAVAQEAASRVITEASDWPTLVATDGGGVTDIMRAYAERIAAGDSDAAQAMAQFEGAPGWDGVDRSALGEEIYNEVLGDRR